MKVITRVKDGVCTVVVVDASDNTTVRSETVEEDQQVVVVATTAHSPADLEVYGPEAIPEPEAEAAEGGEVEEEAAEPTGDEQDSGGQHTGEAEGAEAPADEHEQAA